MSFSFALPISRKFFERTLVHLSFAITGEFAETFPKKQKAIAMITTRRFGIDSSWAEIAGNRVNRQCCFVNPDRGDVRCSSRLYKPETVAVNSFADDRTSCSCFNVASKITQRAAISAWGLRGEDR